MKVLATKKTMTEKEAVQKARGGGNVFGKALYGSKDIHLRLMYLESIEITFRAHYKPPILSRLFSREYTPDMSQKICMIVEGTRCTASYNERPLQLISMNLPEDDVQKCAFPEEKIIETAKRVAKRIMRRQAGKIVTTWDVESYRPFVRPYYVAFYGEPKMGERIRYLPIEADGFKVERSL